ncbi:OmpA family protein, partial [Mycobacterium tuberculosis]|nr:OmpA family protein [Mycobacterium tuberculosis]
ITFATDQDAVKPQFFATLNSVAVVLRKFDRSIIDVYGHTDNVVGQQYNQLLSERRALSVSNYLTQQGIDNRRFSVRGFGMDRP